MKIVIYCQNIQTVFLKCFIVCSINIEIFDIWVQQLGVKVEICNPFSHVFRVNIRVIKNQSEKILNFFLIVVKL